MRCHQSNRVVSLVWKNLTGLPKSEPHWRLLGGARLHHIWCSCDWTGENPCIHVPASCRRVQSRPTHYWFCKMISAHWVWCLSHPYCWSCCKLDFWGIDTGEPLKIDAPPTSDVRANRKRTAWRRMDCCCLGQFSQWQVNADRDWMAASDSRRSYGDFEGNRSIPNGEEVRNVRDTGVQTDAKVQG